MAELVHAILYRGALPTEVKAAMGLRMAQKNGSPYVAAHAIRALKASDRGAALLAAIERDAARRREATTTGSRWPTPST